MVLMTKQEAWAIASALMSTACLSDNRRMTLGQMTGQMG
jgi:hypothetical protein